MENYHWKYFHIQPIQLAYQFCLADPILNFKELMDCRGKTLNLRSECRLWHHHYVIVNQRQHFSVSTLKHIYGLSIWWAFNTESTSNVFIPRFIKWRNNCGRMDGFNISQVATFNVFAALLYATSLLQALNTLRPRQDGRQFPDDIFNAFSWMKKHEFWL